MGHTYGELIGSKVSNILSPSEKRGFPSDAERAARRRAALRHSAVTRVTTGLPAWASHALEALGAPLQGSGVNGAWTKADIEEVAGDGADHGA